MKPTSLAWKLLGSYSVLAAFTLSFDDPPDDEIHPITMGRITPITMVLYDRCVSDGQPNPPVERMDCPDTIDLAGRNPKPTTILLKNKTNLIVMEGDDNDLDRQNQITIKISWRVTLNGILQTKLDDSLPNLIQFGKSRTGKNGGFLSKDYDSATSTRIIKWVKYYDDRQSGRHPEKYNRTWLNCTELPKGYAIEHLETSISSGYRKANAHLFPPDRRFHPDLEPCKVKDQCTQKWTFQP